MKERIDQLGFLKIKKKIAHVKDNVKRIIKRIFLPKTGRKYLQKSRVITDCYLKAHRTLKLTIRKLKILLKNGPNTLKDTLSKKIYE